MNNFNNKFNQINLMIDKELKYTQKIKKYTLTIGIILILLVYYFLFNFTNAFYKNLNTQNIANIVAYSISSKFKITPELENLILQSFTRKIHFMKQNTVIAVKTLSKDANVYFKNYLIQIFNNVDQILENEIMLHGHPYRQKLLKQLEIMSNEDLAKQELSGINIVIQEAIFKEVDVYLDESFKSIKNIETKINALLIKKDLSEKEKLIKDFIKYWTNFFEFNFEMNGQFKLDLKKDEKK